jgi:hypothetical protein
VTKKDKPNPVEKSKDDGERKDSKDGEETAKPKEVKSLKHPTAVAERKPKVVDAGCCCMVPVSSEEAYSMTLPSDKVTVKQASGSEVSPTSHRK